MTMNMTKRSTVRTRASTETENRAIRQSRRMRASRSVFSCAALAAAFVLGGCGGTGEQASKMTSFSTTESAESNAELFSLPADQMAHIQIYAVAQAPLVRNLRVSGSGGVRQFPDDARHHPSGWPRQPHRGHARRTRARGRSASVRYQPGLLAVAFVLPEGAGRLRARGQILQASTRSVRAQSHRGGRTGTGRIRSHASGSRSAVRRAGHSSSRFHESGKCRDQPSLARNCRCWRRWRERWWSGCALLDSCCRPAEHSASRSRTRAASGCWSTSTRKISPMFMSARRWRSITKPIRERCAARLNTWRPRLIQLRGPFRRASRLPIRVSG